jgi:hypothetical protein
MHPPGRPRNRRRSLIDPSQNNPSGALTASPSDMAASPVIGRDAELAGHCRAKGRTGPPLTVAGGVNSENPVRPCRIVTRNHVWPTSTTSLQAPEQHVLSPPQEKVGDDRGGFADQPDGVAFP